VSTPTSQQLAIRASICAGRNLRVCAHAGAGKTTTLLWAFGHLPHTVPRRVLFLEYNRDLRIEAKERAKAAGVNCVVVHNYDSFLVEFYDPAAPSHDFQLAMRRVLLEDARPLRDFGFETIVVDEVQDMTEPYRDFVLKILRDNKPLNSQVQLILAGDPKQTIYGFRGARAEYLLSPQENWPGSSDSYPDLLTLGKTFRFGPELCGFVNDLCRRTFLKESWIGDIESADPDALGTVELWDIDEDEPTALVERYIASLSNGGETTAIMSSSIREENVFMGRFVEACSAHGRAPVEGGDEDETVSSLGSPPQQHASLRTVHTAKGKQYDTVFLFMVQAGQWLTPTGRLKIDRSTVLYVGVTRARRHLVLIQDSYERVAERLWTATSHGAEWRWGPPKLASSGCVRTSLVPVPCKLLQVPWSHPSDVALLDKNLNPVRKDELMALLNYKLVPFDSPMQVSPPSALEELAIFLRALPIGTGPMAPLEDWARGKRNVDPEVAYARLSLGAQASHKYLERFGEVIAQLSPKLDRWEDWFIIASFHPSRRYGHVHLRGEPPPRSDVCENIMKRLVNLTRGSSQINGHKLINTSSCAICSTGHIFYLLVEEKDVSHRRTLVLPIFASTEGTRPIDVFAASISARRQDCETARIDYIHRGVSVHLRGVAGFKAMNAATVTNSSSSTTQ
jgi:hypothetical protein